LDKENPFSICISKIYLLIRMTEYYLKVGYALSDRSQCKGCGKMIDKGALRISYVTNVLGNHYNSYH
jgi:hypothetical protein